MYDKLLLDDPLTVCVITQYECTKSGLAVDSVYICVHICVCVCVLLNRGMAECHDLRADLTCSAG